MWCIFKMSGVRHCLLSICILGTAFSYFFFHYSNIYTFKFIISCIKINDSISFGHIGPLAGFILYSSQAWQVKMQSNIRGLVGSCLVIPCTFDYYLSPPRNPHRVVWYQYVNHGYPLVYDIWNPNRVIGIFRGRTFRVHMSAYSKECTLKIFPVTWFHHRQKIYPWVDPENVGKGTYRFFDTTVTIEVSGKLSWSV